MAQRASDFRRFLDAGVNNRTAMLMRTHVTDGPKGKFLPRSVRERLTQFFAASGTCG